MKISYSDLMLPDEVPQNLSSFLLKKRNEVQKRIFKGKLIKKEPDKQKDLVEAVKDWKFQQSRREKNRIALIENTVFLNNLYVIEIPEITDKIFRNLTTYRILDICCRFFGFTKNIFRKHGVEEERETPKEIICYLSHILLTIIDKNKDYNRGALSRIKECKSLNLEDCNDIENYIKLCSNKMKVNPQYLELVNKVILYLFSEMENNSYK